MNKKNLFWIVLILCFSISPDALARRIKTEDTSKRGFKYIYGPVSSWRLGVSLGIDPISEGIKICSFDCFYCQAGETEVLTTERRVFVETEVVLNEVRTVLEDAGGLDYITFAGRGEPTLAYNLGEIVEGIKEMTDIPIAILTNATLLNRQDVQQDLKAVDFVIAKIDAYDEESFQVMNHPRADLSFVSVIEGIKVFREIYQGKLGIQIMFTQENKDHAAEIARIVREIKPDEVQLNTPLRPRVSELNEEEMFEIKAIFEEAFRGIEGVEIIMVYEAERKEVTPMSERATLQRRGEVEY